MHIKNDYPMYVALINGKVGDYEFDLDFLDYYDEKKMQEIAVRMTFCFHSIKKHYYITDTFHDAFSKALPKLFEANKELPINHYKESMLILHSTGFAMHHMITINGFEHCEFFLFSKVALIGYGIIQTKYETTEKEIKFDGYVCTKKYEDGNALFLKLWSDYATLMTFMEQCEIETKVVESNKKYKTNGTKIYNDTKQSITFLDCRWFTELIRTTPFLVSGHLRWQPCGEGNKKRKLIWVDSYEKKGYHRRATKEIETN